MSLTQYLTKFFVLAFNIKTDYLLIPAFLQSNKQFYAIYNPENLNHISSIKQPMNLFVLLTKLYKQNSIFVYSFDPHRLNQLSSFNNNLTGSDFKLIYINWTYNNKNPSIYTHYPHYPSRISNWTNPPFFSTTTALFVCVCVFIPPNIVHRRRIPRLNS